MVRLGFHVSISGGVDKAVDRARAMGCDVFQIFSRNPRVWRSKPLLPEVADGFRLRFRESGLSLAVDHMPYLPNLASPKEDVYLKSIDVLAEELVRCHALSIPYLVTHLGSHLGAGLEQGSMRIAGALENAFLAADDDVMLLLENTAGTRNSMGGRFEDLAAIIDALGQKSRRVGVCLDTCHLFASGYELRDSQGLQVTLECFESTIGLERLKLVHLNDCRGGLGSHLDRHEHIGLGQIGEKGFRALLCHPLIRELPMIMETPVDDRRDDLGNLRAARKMAELC
ncbi:MAG: endonuclease IV [Methanosaeta sp. PtaU1.Bin060]|nr:MAG: endonuclease IV [Methanosaeta sp. PtaU1.Bin060]